jgi:hypothetical protein
MVDEDRTMMSAMITNFSNAVANPAVNSRHRLRPQRPANRVVNSNPPLPGAPLQPNAVATWTMDANG